MAPRGPSERGWPLIAAAIVLLAGGFAGSLVVGRAAAASRYAFNRPDAIVQNGGHLWIANGGGNSLTETTSSGAWIRTVAGATYGFCGPNALANNGGYLFVVNHCGSVTEVNASTGAFVRLIKGTKYDFGAPVAAVVQGSNLWVVDSASSAVTELNASTGALIRVLTNTSGHYGFKVPDAITVAGADLWVTSRAGGSASDANAGAATEIAASNGAFVRRVTAPADGLEKPSGVAFDGTHLWVTDAATNAVTELTTAGALVRVVANSSLDQNYGFDAPTVVVASGGYVYVISPPGASPMVTQITASSAEGNWYECNTNSPDPNFNNPTGLAVYGGSVWVVSPGDNTLTQLSLALGGNRVGLFT